MLVKSVWIVIWTRTKEICRFFHWLRSAAVYKSHHVVPPVKHQRQYHQYTVGNLHVLRLKCACQSNQDASIQKLYSLHRWHRIYKMYTWSSWERCISWDPCDPPDPLPCEQWHPSQMSWIRRRKIDSLETFDLRTRNGREKKKTMFFIIQNLLQLFVVDLKPLMNANLIKLFFFLLIFIMFNIIAKTGHWINRKPSTTANKTNHKIIIINNFCCAKIEKYHQKPALIIQIETIALAWNKSRFMRVR